MATTGRLGAALRFARRNKAAVAGAAVLLAIVLVAIAAPLLATGNPLSINPLRRLRPPSAAFWFGTDHLGRDLWNRVLYGARVSLLVGGAVAGISMSVGLVIGLVAGYVRSIDAIVMRVMDGLMAIPSILLAVALTNVIVAISVAEIPRVVRLVRSLVLTLRDEVYVQAAISSGTRLPRILRRHILPNVMGPVLVQGTYIFAAAILIEAALSFLGAGTPSNVPSWGNTISEGRPFFLLAAWIVIIPGMFLSATVLAVNLLGDGLRDALDPRLSRQL